MYVLCRIKQNAITKSYLQRKCLLNEVSLFTYTVLARKPYLTYYLNYFKKMHIVVSEYTEYSNFD